MLSTHLTSFTVLLSVNGVDDFSKGEVKALSIVTYVGCAISIVCLILTIAVLLILRCDPIESLARLVCSLHELVRHLMTLT